MKITTYEQLNKLVAESLGWEKSVEYSPSDTEIEVYSPADIQESDFEDWFNDYGVVPDFCNEIYVVEKFLIPQCDRTRLVTQITVTPTMVSCGIKPLTPDGIHSGMAVTGEKGIPKSVALAVCLAWLRFKGVEFELALPAEETSINSSATGS